MLKNLYLNHLYRRRSYHLTKALYLEHFEDFTNVKWAKNDYVEHLAIISKIDVTLNFMGVSVVSVAHPLVSDFTRLINQK